MKRNKHSLSHYKLLTCKMGELVPVACYPVLPGDSVQQSASALIRCSPLLAPVMHPVSVRFHHWFVPNRLLWAGWEDFITGGSDGEGGSSGEFPTVDPGGGGFAAGALMDYFGIPPSVDTGPISALPVRAYNLIFNENYRDEDLVTARGFTTASGVDATSPVTLASIAWEKDYFTSARPWTQKGPEVSVPLGTEAPVMTSGSQQVSGAQQGLTWRNTSTGAAPGSAALIGAAATSGITDLSQTTYTAGANLYPSNLFADLSAATAASVNAIREAFALQRYQEARARYGSRYTEYLRYLGVRSSDARLQRPEYLGGGKQTIAFSEVLQTGPDSAGDGVANLKGHGIAALRSRRFRRFFEEHGYVLTLMSVRPRTMYVSGVERDWFKTTKEDFWQKELEHIGQQEVYNREVYAADSGPADVFGYQDRYAEYRHIQSKVSGDFRSTLNMWHLGRIFASDPALNSSFVTCDPAVRIFAEQTADNLWCMVSNSIQARRMVTRNPSGRVL